MLREKRRVRLKWLFLQPVTRRQLTLIGRAEVYRNCFLNPTLACCLRYVGDAFGNYGGSALHRSCVIVLGRDLCDWKWVGCISDHGCCAGGRLRSQSGVPGVSFSLFAFTSR